MRAIGDWRPALVQHVPNIIAAASFIVLIWYTHEAQVQADAAQKQLAVMESQAALDRRPYLAIEGGGEIVVQQDASGRPADTTTFVRFVIHLINCGRTPLQFHAVSTSFDTLKSADGPNSTYSVLFPGRTSEYSMNFDILPVTPLALNGKTGRVRFEYRTLGDDRAPSTSYFYERVFTLDFASHRMNFTKEDAN